MKIISFILLFFGLLFPTQSDAYFMGQGYVFADSQNNKTANQASKLRVNSAQQAAQVAKNRMGGKVLKVTKVKRGGRITYKVKLVKNNGHVVSVFVDAATGRLTGN